MKAEQRIAAEEEIGIICHVVLNGMGYCNTTGREAIFGLAGDFYREQAGVDIDFQFHDIAFPEIEDKKTNLRLMEVHSKGFTKGNYDQVLYDILHGAAELKQLTEGGFEEILAKLGCEDVKEGFLDRAHTRLDGILGKYAVTAIEVLKLKIKNTYYPDCGEYDTDENIAYIVDGSLLKSNTLIGNQERLSRTRLNVGLENIKVGAFSVCHALGHLFGLEHSFESYDNQDFLVEFLKPTPNIMSYAYRISEDKFGFELDDAQKQTIRKYVGGRND